MIFIYLFIKYHIFWYILSINVDFIESSLYTTKFYSIYGQKKLWMYTIVVFTKKQKQEEMGIPYEMGMLYDIKLPKISWNTINIYLCDRTVSTIALCHRSHFTAWNHTRGILWDGRIPYAGWNRKTKRLWIWYLTSYGTLLECSFWIHRLRQSLV